MSLTSYRAAPPRVNLLYVGIRLRNFHKEKLFVRLADLAATYSPAS